MDEKTMLFVLEHFSGDAEKLKQRMLDALIRAKEMNRPIYASKLEHDLKVLEKIVNERKNNAKLQ